MSIDDGVPPGARLTANRAGDDEVHTLLPVTDTADATTDFGADEPDFTEAAESREVSERLAAARARDRTDREIRLAQQAQRRLQAEEAARIAAEERHAAEERLAKESAARLELEHAATEAARLREEADRRALAASLTASDLSEQATRAASARVDAELRAQAVAERRASLERARIRAEGARKARRVVAILALLAAFALGAVVTTYWKAFRSVEESGFLLHDLRIDTRWETFGERRR